MSALFLAIPLTIFVLFVLPIWLWLHYSNRSGRSELSQSEQQRLEQLADEAKRIANYFDVPVKLVRILVVLSIFFGLALFTLVAYIILSFALDPMPDNMAFGEQLPSSSELLDEVDRELAASETRLREMERYVTSDTFTLRSRFRQL